MLSQGDLKQLKFACLRNVNKFYTIFEFNNTESKIPQT